MAEGEEAITLKTVAMAPNDCPLVGTRAPVEELPAEPRAGVAGGLTLLDAQGSALTIKMTFTAGKPVAKAVWDLKYMVDMASKRKLIGLCSLRAVVRASVHGARVPCSSA